ncbi:MAG: hypothetical protein COB33_010765 [Thiotrichaceae bacterium]|nr:hypothetical protein [Thiotrichaceae bacterium]
MNPLSHWIDKKIFVMALRVLGALSFFNFFMLLMAFFSLQEQGFSAAL